MRGFCWTLHTGSHKRSGGNFLAKSCLSRLQQSDPGAEVWQVRSMTARWIQEHDLRCVVAVFQSPARGKFSQRAKSTPRLSERKKNAEVQRAGPGTSSNPRGGLGWRVTSGEGRRAHTSAFSPGLDALGWMFGLRVKPLCVSVVLKAVTLPSSISLSLSFPPYTPFCLYGWLVRQRQ